MTLLRLDSAVVDRADMMNGSRSMFGSNSERGFVARHGSGSQPIRRCRVEIS